MYSFVFSARLLAAFYHAYASVHLLTNQINCTVFAKYCKLHSWSKKRILTSLITFSALLVCILPHCRLRDWCGNLQNDSGHVVCRLDQSASFRIFNSTFYFPHFTHIRESIPLHRYRSVHGLRGCPNPIQSNMSVHHYECVALCFVNILQRARSWAASLASGSPV